MTKMFNLASFYLFIVCFWCVCVCVCYEGGVRVGSAEGERGRERGEAKGCRL